jgi:hypothetical protein
MLEPVALDVSTPPCPCNPPMRLIALSGRVVPIATTVALMAYSDQTHPLDDTDCALHDQLGPDGDDDEIQHDNMVTPSIPRP